MATHTAIRQPVSTVQVTDDSIVIRIVRPAAAGGDQAAGVSAATSGAVRESRAARLGFAARVDSFAGVVMWHRY
ncbi:MAG: hypothetical protein WBA98_11465, partial [Gordonia sp. (in: high G+C Gram-positive bacteria)]